MSIEVPSFQHSLGGSSKDLKKEHICYEKFCKTQFLGQEIPSQRMKLFGKLIFTSLIQKSSKQQ